MQLYLFVIATVVGYVACYDPNWESLDSCPCPEWFDKSKPGIFVHWGMYSVPAYATEWISRYWADKHKDVLDFINRNFPGQSYGDLASKFSAADFTGKGSADIVKASGAKYFVVTSKHHDGYTLWPSTTSLNWNAVDIGAHRDLIQEFKEGITEAGIHFGLYFSQMDWFHHLYISDPHNKTTLYTDQVSLVQMRELIHNYEPDLLWSDGDWERPDTYWKATQFIAWLFNDSPVKDKIVVNDRWGAGIPGHHGSYITGTDKFMPGKLLKRKWECCLPLDRYSFGYRRRMNTGDVLSMKEVLNYFVRILAWGGNFLLNIGPNSLGIIDPLFEERLRDLGSFTNANGEAIYESKPWIYQNESDYIWYTSKTTGVELDKSRVYNPQLEEATTVYAFVTKFEDKVEFKLPKPTDKTKNTLLGKNTALKFKYENNVLTVSLPSFRNLPRLDCIVLKLENLQADNYRPVLHDY